MYTPLRLYQSESLQERLSSNPGFGGISREGRAASAHLARPKNRISLGPALGSIYSSSFAHSLVRGLRCYYGRA
jgi:hypothetical protein